ncbi:MAG: S1C family serine protease [Pirellulales bacterium]|jgi:serine protease Do|tara:strand:- start:612 stop:1820 length:1209 start_codon:yes stop_codon:yes gene_type:complete
MTVAPFSILRSHIVAAAWLAHIASGPIMAADQDITPLRPIQATTTDTTDRVDPSISRRLSLTERERLYDKVVRDARQLEMQGAQLRRLSVLLRPAVVHIDALKTSSRGRVSRDDEQEAGSGVITNLADEVVIITNRHVIHGADLANITIRLDDGREIQPSRVWTDADTDIGVMLINESHLPTARLAEGNGVQIGDTVLAIGSPFGLAHSVTLGIVSAKGRRDLELGEGGIRFQNFIQTDAAINPGNSGGPLVNLRGEVVGLNTCIASNSGGFEGIGFAIPISMVMFVARQLVETGTVSRAYLGVALDKTFTLATAHNLGMTRPVGARVTGITPGSPAEEIGLLPNDIILEFAGNPIEDDDHLVSMVSMTPTNQEVRIRVFRNGQPLSLEVTVASREAFEPPQ